jgi:SAM-dependent methyltransferase
MPGQRWDPETYRQNARFVADLGLDLLTLLKARPGERILDFGCGDGALTEKIRASGCWVIGLDSSLEQAQAARGRELDVIVAEGPCLPFDQAFHAVFSNATLHWIRDAELMLESVHRALVPGGRFIAELGGIGNIEVIRAALRSALMRRGLNPDVYDPWMFPSAEEYSGLLESRGFFVESMDLFPRPTVLPGHLAQWLETFAQSFMHELGPPARRDFINEVCIAVRPRLYHPDRGWVADYVRLRFAATRRAK